MVQRMLPPVSKVVYWNELCKYRAFTGGDPEVCPTELPLMAYLIYLKDTRKLKQTSIWKMYSCLKSVLKVKFDLDISSFHRLQCFITSGEEEETKKANIFSFPDLVKICESGSGSDVDLLVASVAITSFFGGLRVTECFKLKRSSFKYVEDGSIVVEFTRLKKRGRKRTDQRKQTMIIRDVGHCHFAQLVRRYLKMADIMGIKSDDSPWCQIFKDGLKPRPISKNRFSKFATDCCSFLGREPEGYSFHSFRRSAASAVAANGGTAQMMMMFFGWASETMTAEYTTNSEHSMFEINKRIIGEKDSKASCLQRAGQMEDVLVSEIVPVSVVCAPEIFPVNGVCGSEIIPVSAGLPAETVAPVPAVDSVQEMVFTLNNPEDDVPIVTGVQEMVITLDNPDDAEMQVVGKGESSAPVSVIKQASPLSVQVKQLVTDLKEANDRTLLRKFFDESPETMPRRSRLSKKSMKFWQVMRQLEEMYYPQSDDEAGEDGEHGVGQDEDVNLSQYVFVKKKANL